jgi:hypothetical protein
MVRYYQHVEIVDTKISVLYFTCLIVYYALSGIALFSLPIIWVVQDISHNMQVIVRPVSYNYTALKESFETIAKTKDFCTNSSKYDFWFDNIWRYDDIRCATLCSEYEMKPDCFSKDRIVEQAQNSEVLFVTEIEDEPLWSHHWNESQDMWKAGRNMIPKTELLEKPFKQYIAYDPSLFAIRFVFGIIRTDMSCVQNPFRTDCVKKHSTRNNMHIVITTYDRKFFRYVPAGAIPLLNLREILEISASNLDIDGISPMARPNKLPNASQNGNVSTGPLLRVTGIHIKAKVYCSDHSRDFKGIEGFKPPDLPGEDLLCEIRWHAHVGPWAGRGHVQPVDKNGLTRFRNNHGIRIFFERTAVLHSFGIGYCLFGILLIVVCHRFIPKYFVHWFATHCLGHYSVMYKRALKRVLSSKDRYKSSFAHVLAHSIVFDALKDPDKQRLTKETACRLLTLALKAQMVGCATLKSEIKLKAVVDFIHGSMKSRSKKSPTYLEYVRKSMPGYTPKVERSKVGVDISEFVNACSGNQLTPYPRIRQMFRDMHKKKRLSCLSIFADPSIVTGLEQAQVEYTEHFFAVTRKPRPSKRAFEFIESITNSSFARRSTQDKTQVEEELIFSDLIESIDFQVADIEKWFADDDPSSGGGPAEEDLVVGSRVRAIRDFQELRTRKKLLHGWQGYVKSFLAEGDLLVQFDCLPAPSMVARFHRRHLEAVKAFPIGTRVCITETFKGKAGDDVEKGWEGSVQVFYEDGDMMVQFDNPDQKIVIGKENIRHVQKAGKVGRQSSCESSMTQRNSSFAGRTSSSGEGSISLSASVKSSRESVRSEQDIMAAYASSHSIPLVSDNKTKTSGSWV